LRLVDLILLVAASYSSTLQFAIVSVIEFLYCIHDVLLLAGQLLVKPSMSKWTHCILISVFQ
jgi:hypothetical protein